MRVSTIIASGLKITFNPKDLPLTSDLKNLIAGKQSIKPTEATPSPLKPAKKIALTRGETSPQNSAKKRFEAPISDDQKKGRNTRRSCKWNDGRKSKTFSRVTIRGTAFIN